VSVSIKPAPTHSSASGGGSADLGREPNKVKPRSFRASDASALFGSMLAAAALVWLLFGVLLPVDNTAMASLAWMATFLLTYRFALKHTEGVLVARDRVMAVVVGALAAIVLAALTSIVIFVTVRGIKYLSTTFFTQTMEFTGPVDPSTEGGIAHALVGTLQQILLATLISVPLGVLTAVYLNEVGGRFSRSVRMFVNAMSGVPSIVAGLFIFATMNVGLGWSFSGFQAALALSILMLPTVTRTSEEILRLVPGGLREASLALGSTEWRSTWQVVLPTAKTGIVTAVILGVARVIGETAPLFMTAGGSPVMNANPFEGAQESLPLYIFRQVKQFSNEQTIPRGFAAALVLLVLVLVLFVTARAIARPKVERTGRKWRRRPRRSRTRGHRAGTSLASGTARGRRGAHRKPRLRRPSQRGAQRSTANPTSTEEEAL